MKTATHVTLLSLSLTLAAVVAVSNRTEFPAASRVASASEGPDDEDAPECPGPNFMVQVLDTMRGAPRWIERHFVEIARGISVVPEFHDCQRFVVRTPLGTVAYDALYAIFAARNLDKLNFRPNLNGGDPADIAFVAAEVYTKKGEYPLLGIRNGFNCLYLSRANNWEAFMVATGRASDKSCQPVLTSQQRARATKLKVHRTTEDGLGLLDYPGVTRWDRDQRGNYYITMKCADGWCDVGLSDPALRSPALMVGAGMPEPLRRVRTIKGWYDQQTLAIADNANLNVRPTGVVATVIPDPKLTDLTFESGTEEHVATVEIGSLPDYETKLGLKPGRNELFLVRNGTEWTAWMGPPGAPDRRKLFVGRHDHTGKGFNIPGTVRWRWLSKDETIWVRCLEGCCQVQSTPVGGEGEGPLPHTTEDARSRHSSAREQPLEIRARPVK